MRILRGGASVCLFFVLASVISSVLPADTLKINPVTGLLDLVGSSGGGSIALTNTGVSVISSMTTLDVRPGAGVLLTTSNPSAGIGRVAYSIDTTVVPTITGAAFSTLTDGATVTWDANSVFLGNATVTLGGNRTLVMANLVDGGSYVLRVVQDGTGSRTLALGSGCTWKVSNGGSGAITPSTAAGSVDILAFTYLAASTTCYANFQKNFS